MRDDQVTPVLKAQAESKNEPKAGAN